MMMMNQHIADDGDGDDDNDSRNKQTPHQLGSDI